MESLNGSSYDVVICGTGIRESLLALALSRSGKKILHLDRHDCYGGTEAALSLQEAESFVNLSKDDPSAALPFRNVAVVQRQQLGDRPDGVKLSFSRAYSLSLAPRLIHTRSELLPLLVSSKVYRHLEFLAVGSWWTLSGAPKPDTSGGDAVEICDTPNEKGKNAETVIRKVPNGREDIFADDGLDLKSKRALMKLVRAAATFGSTRASDDNEGQGWGEESGLLNTDQLACKSFQDYLIDDFGLGAALQEPLLALTLSLGRPEDLSAVQAMQKLSRHLRSIGVFGPGFAAVLPRWGGLSEVVQVSCRACAVGGAVYLLGQGVVDLQAHQATETPSQEAAQLRTDADGPNSGNDKVPESTKSTDKSRKGVRVDLSNGEFVTSEWVVGSPDNLPTNLDRGTTTANTTVAATQILARSISIVASKLTPLFPDLPEGAPPPAAAVVTYFPASRSTSEDDGKPSVVHPPVQMLVHSSDTGECASGQSVVYSSVAMPLDQAGGLLDVAIKSLLQNVGVESGAELWTLRYEQLGEQSGLVTDQGVKLDVPTGVIVYQQRPLDVAFDDVMMDDVRSTWKTIVGDECTDEFMVFADIATDVE